MKVGGDKKPHGFGKMLIQSRRNIIHCSRTEKAATPFLFSVFTLIVMSNPTVVLDPYATVDLRNVVQQMVDYHIVAITGQAEWYPVAFFLREENGEVLGGLLGGYLGEMAARYNPCGSRACAKAWLWQGIDAACRNLCGRTRLHQCIPRHLQF
jgi:hypothetical protein